MNRVNSPRPLPTAAAAHQGTHHQRLARLRDQERQRRQIIVAIAGIVSLLLLAGGLAWIDFSRELTTGMRAIGWLAVVAVLGCVAAASRRWLAYDATDAVHQAEQQWPDVGQRLRTSHDYQNHPDSVAPADPELLRALEAETGDRVARQPIEPLGKPWPIYWLLGCAGASVAIWMLALLIWPEWRIATARLGLLPVHYSQVQMEPLPKMVHQGEDLAVKLHVDGRPLSTAQLRYRQEGQTEWQSIEFQPEVAELLINDLKAVIPDCQGDLELQVNAGPLQTESQVVTVRLPLVLETWKAAITPPSYTGLSASEGAPESLRIPEGSQLQLEAKYNRAPQDVDAGVIPENPSAIDTQLADNTAQLSLASLRQPSDLQVMATTADGVSDESSLHLDIIRDHAPKLNFVAPEDNAEAIATAELRFRLEAADDYGLQSVGIRYRIDDGPEQTLWESDPATSATRSADSSPAMATTIVLPLEELGVAYPQAITYYAYAMDNRQPEPQRVTSELRFIDIRPFSRQYEFKDGQCSGNCQGECLTLEKLIKEQRAILGQTFAAVQQGTARQQGAAASGTGAKLAKQENELRAKTEALTSALEQKVGPMPSLVFAGRSMVDAEKELADESIPEGQVHEEHALAYLVAARTNLRKILKQSNSQSQMCRNVDREQMDQLRKPPQQSEQQQQPSQKQQQEQQLAQLRKQLEKIANQQESFCQSASACQQASQASVKSQSPQSQSPQSQSPQSQSPNPSADHSDGNRQSNTRQASPPAVPTAEQLAQQQQQAAKETADVQQALEAGGFGELASQRAEQARQSIQQSGQSVAKESEFDEAIAKAQQAANQLRQLSEHLGRKHAPDFLDKLSSAEREAQQLADEQKELAHALTRDAEAATETAAGSATSSAAEREDSAAVSGDRQAQQANQQQLADRGEALADLVAQLLADASEQDWQLQRELSEQVASNPPQSAAEAMRAAAGELQRGQPRPASSQGLRASALLERLASGIRQVQQASGREQLDRLTKAEQAAASLIKRLEREGSAAERAMAESETRQFSSQLQALARNDGELARANQALGAWNSNARIDPESRNEERAVENPQFATSPRRMVDALRDVDVILQRRIQETIVRGAMQQAVGAVPPQYSEMVDEYYRALSEDIE